MPEVVLVGANSQVAAEVALYLQEDPELKIVGLVRSPYSATLLRLAGVPWSVLDYDKGEDLKRLLGPANLVVDFTYPAVQLPELIPAIRHNTSALMAALPRGCRYVLASSIMAFGTPDTGLLRHHAVPHSSYAYIKREAESLTLQLGQSHGIETIRLRLGQVHGELQSVTREYRDRLCGTHLVVEGAPSDLSSTVFTSSVAAALAGLARGKAVEGLCTLVSSPQWTLQQLYDYYARRYQTPSTVSYQPGRGRPGYKTVLRGFVAGLLKPSQRVRTLAEIGLFMRHPQFFARSKGPYRIRAAAADAAAMRPAASVMRHLVGPVPGPTLSDIASAPDTVLEAQKRLAERLERCLAQGRRSYEAGS